MTKISRIGVFITSHGFGHATRTCAVLNEISKTRSCSFIIFSTLPQYFFLQNLNFDSFELVSLKTDVGLVQEGPFAHDLTKTYIELEEFLLFKSSDFQKALTLSRDKELDLIICDISPLGLEVSHRLGIPSVLIENFTWDWIYEAYQKMHSGWSDIIDRISKVYENADLRIQAKPFCLENDNSVKVPPISRSLIRSPDEIRKKLGCDRASKLIILTTGGITKELLLSEKLKVYKNYTFILSGDFKITSRDQNIISLPMSSSIHYPDLVNASNLVVGKVGYGTLAECWATETPLIGCFRNNFRESEVLRKFVKQNIQHKEISIDDFESMNWVSDIQNILSVKSFGVQKANTNGVSLAANHIINFLK